MKKSKIKKKKRSANDDDEKNERMELESKWWIHQMKSKYVIYRCNNKLNSSEVNLCETSTKIRSFSRMWSSPFASEITWLRREWAHICTSWVVLLISTTYFHASTSNVYFGSTAQSAFFKPLNSNCSVMSLSYALVRISVSFHTSKRKRKKKALHCDGLCYESCSLERVCAMRGKVTYTKKKRYRTIRSNESRGNFLKEMLRGLRNRQRMK